MTDAMATHSEPELLAAFVDGHLDPEQLQLVTAHLASCEECRAVIGEAVAFEREEVGQTQRHAWWLEVAAAAALVALLAFPGYRWYQQREIAKREQALFAAQGVDAQHERSITGRFSSQMAYAKHTTLRGSAEEVPYDVQDAAFQVLEKTAGNDSQLAIRARAAANAALKEQPASDTLAMLQKIPANARDAATWNDIAALALATGESLPAARDAVEAALKRQPKMPEALFNRALILQAMNDPQAAAAWKDYLAVDPRSAWADEAQSKLNQIQ